ncbi:hypothetical protein ACLI4Z_18105 [Natrialbaceae archaeon A-arb3/5]
MTPENEKPNLPDELPTDAVEVLNQLNETELRAVIDYAKQRYEYTDSALRERIEAAPGEEIVSIEEDRCYTRVVKRQPCGKNCDDCPHGPFSYHVREEPRIDGETELHWTYLGPVKEQ